LTAKRRRHVARPRHPVTGRPLYVSAATAGELARIVGELGVMRRELRWGLTSADDVARKLARMKHGPVTLERAARSYMDSSLAPNTRRRVASALATHLAPLAPLELAALEAPRLAAWIDRLRAAGLASSTVALQWKTLRSIVRHAQERGVIASAPWGTWRPTVRAASSRAARLGGREAARSPGELALLIATAAEMDVELRARGRLGGLEAKIATASLLGLRQRELAGLRWPDVDPAAGVVAVVRQGEGQPTKSGSVDRLAALPELLDVLERWRLVLAERGAYTPDGPVFPYLARHERAWNLARSTCGGFDTPRTYPPRVDVLSGAALRRVVTLAGLPHPERWTPHSLRDSFVTLSAAAAGGDLRTVQRSSRHRTLGSLVRYLRELERSSGVAPALFALPAPAKPRLMLVRPHPKDEANVREGIEEANRGDLLSAEESAAYLRDLLGEEPAPKK
jgi:integrase